MNVNSLIAALLPTAPSPATADSAAASMPADPGSSAQFKAQFGQAVAALTAVVAAGNGPAASSASSATAGSGSISAQTTDALQTVLQKKINDLLASGASVSDIVTQLAAALANAFAGQFGGSPGAIQTQLQTAFATALSPPGTGPPVSTADLASTLAQRFRQIADLAAGVIGETGQSNRLFAGSFSDAVSTAGGQPAPGSTNGTTADSSASNANAFLANLTALPGDGQTVATTAPAAGTNGDTLLGRILARAAQASQNGPAPTPSGPAGAASAATTDGKAAPAAALVDRALAAATAVLGQPVAAVLRSIPVTPAPASTLATVAAASVPADFLATTTPSALATASSTDTSATAAPTVSTEVAAFVKSFSDALSAISGSAPSTTTDKASTDGPRGTVLPTTIASAQAPTIGAFAPVAPALRTDSVDSNPAPAMLPQPAAATDPNAVIEQILRGAFLNTVGPTSTLRLKLVPESLGDVSVKLAINGSSVAAQVIAQTPAAHDALVAGQSQLTRALSDAGLKLSSFNVSLAGGFASFQQQQQPSAQQQAFSGRHLLIGDVDTTDTDETSLLAVPSFAPPSSTASGWGAYNYLV